MKMHALLTPLLQVAMLVLHSPTATADRSPMSTSRLRRSAKHEAEAVQTFDEKQLPLVVVKQEDGRFWKRFVMDEMASSFPMNPESKPPTPTTVTASPATDAAIPASPTTPPEGNPPTVALPTVTAGPVVTNTATPATPTTPPEGTPPTLTPPVVTVVVTTAPENSPPVTAPPSPTVLLPTTITAAAPEKTEAYSSTIYGYTETVPQLGLSSGNGLGPIMGSSASVAKNDIEAGLFVRDLYLSMQETCPDGMERAPWDKNAWDGDLNDDVDGEFIYLCRSRQEDAGDPITQLKIQKSDDCGQGWMLPEREEGLSGDLNQGSVRPGVLASIGFASDPVKIYLCFSRQPNLSAAIREIFVLKDTEKPTQDRMVETPNGELSGDLNESVGGKNIWLSVEKTDSWKFLTSEWKLVKCNENGPITYLVKSSITKSESVSEEFAVEIGATLSGSVGAVEGGISGSVSDTTASAWESATSSEQESELACEIYDDGTDFKSGCMWQWKNIFESDTQKQVTWESLIVKCSRDDFTPPCPPFEVVNTACPSVEVDTANSLCCITEERS